VVLRPREPGDDEVFAGLGADPDVVRWIEDIDADYDVEHARAFVRRAEAERIAGRAILLAIADARTDEPLGECELRIADSGPRTGQLGYLLLAHARGRGYAARAVRLLVDFAFGELSMTRVQAFAHPENVPSQRVLERAGFEREGLLPDYRGPGEDRFMYAKLQP
jgi:RimJ/RimL family protein N-acetyltransferase